MAEIHTLTQTRQFDVHRVVSVGLRIVHHPEEQYIDAVVRVEPEADILLGREGRGFVPEALIDGRISRRHARIWRHRDELLIKDLSSHNGTLVNGERVLERKLSLGDVIGVGPVLLMVVELCGTPPATHTPMIGSSRALQEAVVLAHRVAPLNAAVLILGETGVGKARFAREIHAASGRRGKLVPVNCAALSDDVMMSELFGHARGGLPGAASARRGLVEDARGGTLFLDEIGHSTISFQMAILRLLRDGEGHSAGADRSVNADVRVIVATNRSLTSDVRSGRFRQDLYMRLSRSVIRVPSLRERPEDILPIARHLVEVHSRREIPLTSTLAGRLIGHTWPGNVRELDKVMQRLVVEFSHEEVLPSPQWLEQELGPAAGQPANQAVGHPHDRLPKRRRVAPTADELEASMRRLRGNVSAVAEEFGVSRNTVYRWLKRSGLMTAMFRR